MLIVKSQRGFTLVELAITLVIAAIILGYTVTSFSEWLHNTKIRSSAESIKSALQAARFEAIRLNTRVEFSLSDNAGTPGGNGWVIRLAGQCATFDTSDSACIQQKTDGEGSSGVIVTGLDDSGAQAATTVTFEGTGRRLIRNRNGNALNEDDSPFLARIDIDIENTVLPADKSRDLRIAVGSGGIIRMCDPAVTASGDTRKCD